MTCEKVAKFNSGGDDFGLDDPGQDDPGEGGGPEARSWGRWSSGPRTERTSVETLSPFKKKNRLCSGSYCRV